MSLSCSRLLEEKRGGQQVCRQTGCAVLGTTSALIAGATTGYSASTWLDAEKERILVRFGDRRGTEIGRAGVDMAVQPGGL